MKSLCEITFTLPPDRDDLAARLYPNEGGPAPTPRTVSLSVALSVAHQLEARAAAATPKTIAERFYPEKSKATR